ncbi:MAG: L-fucose:H+ symporter permease [Lentimicrobium sp.]
MNTARPKLLQSGNTNYLVPFMLISSLFLIWGFSHALLDVLNKHFQNVLGISKMESGFVQAAVYGGYFLAAIPAGIFMKRFGYRKGIIMGLLLVATGAFLFIPAAGIREFWSFLVPLFIIACGLAYLETAANPYTTVLGPAVSAERRINLAQSFNAIGWILGPLVGSAVILSTTKGGGSEFTSLAIPYMGLGCIVLFVGIFFFFTRLPEVTIENDQIAVPEISPAKAIPLFKQPNFVFAVIAQFFYVAAQTGVNSFFINYVTETEPSIPDQTAGYILAIGGMGLFWLGRLSGSYLMRRFNPGKLLTTYAIINVLIMVLVISNLGWVSIIALFCTYFFMSIMFPTIFSMGIKGLGPQIKQGSSFLVMAIVGGAISPPLMGYLGDIYSMSVGFVVPLICFGVVLIYGIREVQAQSSKSKAQSKIGI